MRARVCAALLGLSLPVAGCAGADGEPARATEQLDGAAQPTLDAGHADAVAAPDPTDAASDAALSDAAPNTDAAPRLSELVQTFFVPTCVLGRCHTTSVPAADLSFTGRRVSVYAALVNAPSTEQPQRMRVAPFDPDASYLMEKLEHDMPAVGTRMPPMAALPPEFTGPVRAWIAAGARDD